MFASCFFRKILAPDGAPHQRIVLHEGEPLQHSTRTLFKALEHPSPRILPFVTTRGPGLMFQAG